MATWAAITAEWKLAVDVIEDARAHFDGTQLAQLASIQAALEGDFLAPGYATYVQSIRGRMSSVVSIDMAQAIVFPFLREFGKTATLPESTSMADLVQRLYDYMHTNTYSVKYRNITYGSISAGGSNTGTGTVNKLTKDERGYNVENTHVEAKAIRCISDGNTVGGQRNAEVFEAYGVNASPDALGFAGSGQAFKRSPIYAAHCGGGNGGSLLSNASFSSYDSSGSVTTKFPGWTIATDVGDVTQDTSNYYRSYPGASTDASIKFTNNESISQKLSLLSTKVKQRGPYYVQLAYNRQVGSGDGTLTLTLGAASANVSLAAQTGWNILRIALGTDNYYRNFVADDLTLTIALSSWSTGYVLVDDVILVEMDEFDGQFVKVVGGVTPFRLDDIFTWTDTNGGLGTGKMQEWFYRATGRFLPHNSSPTVTDP